MGPRPHDPGTSHGVNLINNRAVHEPPLQEVIRTGISRTAILNPEPDRLAISRHRRHHLPDSVKHYPKLRIVFSFQFINAPGEFDTGSCQLPHLNESSHDSDVNLHSALSFEDAGEHRHPLFGENVRADICDVARVPVLRSQIVTLKNQFLPPSPGT